MKKCIHQISNDEIKKRYPIKDDFWPSRYWNSDLTSYADLSGCNCKSYNKDDNKNNESPLGWGFLFTVLIYYFFI